MKKSLMAGAILTVAGGALLAMTSAVAVGDGDASPHACVDCHKADKKLSTKIASWTTAVPEALLAQAKAASPATLKLKGKHPKIPVGKNIPKNCLMCHGETSKIAPPFNKLMHLIHETGANSLDCRSCHKIDAASGLPTIPNGDEQ